METIQILGSLGEFVGAFAVVATLIYLAIQVGHGREAMEENSRLAQSAVLSTTFVHFSQFRRHIIDDADVARICQAVAAGNEDLVTYMPPLLAGSVHANPGIRRIWGEVRGGLTTRARPNFAEAVDTSIDSLARRQEARQSP